MEGCNEGFYSLSKSWRKHLRVNQNDVNQIQDGSFFDTYLLDPYLKCVGIPGGD